VRAVAVRLAPALHAGRVAGAVPFCGHSHFPLGKLAELLDGLGAVVGAAGGRFTMHYTAAVVTAVRRVRGPSDRPEGWWTGGDARVH
jgi:hypothetical protein